MATTFNADLATTAHADAVPAAARPSFFKRLMGALVEARQRSAEREIERFIAMHGGVLTDNIECDISRTFGSPAGNGRI